MTYKIARSFSTALLLISFSLLFGMNFFPATGGLPLEAKMSIVMIAMDLAFVVSSLCDIYKEGILFTMGLKFQMTMGLCFGAMALQQLLRGEVLAIAFVFFGMLVSVGLPPIIYARKNGISTDEAYSRRMAFISRSDLAKAA